MHYNCLQAHRGEDSVCTNAESPAFWNWTWLLAVKGFAEAGDKEKLHHSGSKCLLTCSQPVVAFHLGSV